MLQKRRYEGIRLKVAPDLGEVLHLGFLGAVGPETGHRCQAELLLRILIQFLVQTDDRCLPLSDDVHDLVGRDVLQGVAEEFGIFVIGPGPFSVVVLLVQVLLYYDSISPKNLIFFPFSQRPFFQIFFLGS